MTEYVPKPHLLERIINNKNLLINLSFYLENTEYNKEAAIVDETIELMEDMEELLK